MMIGDIMKLQQGESRRLELVIDSEGRIEITDAGYILLLIEGGRNIPAQIRKDLIGVVLGIEENPEAERYFSQEILAQQVQKLIKDCRTRLGEYVALEG